MIPIGSKSLKITAHTCAHTYTHTLSYTHAHTYSLSIYLSISLSHTHKPILKYIGARDVTVIVVGNGLRDPSSNLDEAVCISHSFNTLRKNMYPVILSPAMGK